MGAVEDLIDAKLREGLAKRLAAEPWWCRFCGEKGNQHSGCYFMEPDSMMFPPAEHECPPSTGQHLLGIEEALDLLADE